MEIPYVVNARKDTGLYNSKIAIWLFLASEVMLFGGLFSSYIFLRLGADYPWPERVLPVLPGLINTFILILSSMTVVFAWAALKLRKWRSFQINMWITLICATVFMVLKGFEYKAKFGHQAIKMNDYAYVEGHTIPDDGEKHHGVYGKGNFFKMEVSTITVPLTSFHAKYYDNPLPAKYAENAYKKGKFTMGIIQQLKEQGYTAKLVAGDSFADLAAEDEGAYNVAWRKGEQDGKQWRAIYATDFIKGGKRTDVKIADAGTELTVELVEKLKDAYIKANTQRSKANRAIQSNIWNDKRAYPEVDRLKNQKAEERDDRKADVKLVAEIQKKETNELKESFFINVPSSITFEVVPDNDGSEPFVLKVSPHTAQFTAGQSSTEGEESSITYKDNTNVSGTVADSAMVIAVDGLDFNHLVIKAEAAGIDPQTAISESRILEYPSVNKLWAYHQDWLKYHTERLAKKGREPNHLDKYRVTWKQMVAYKKLSDKGEKITQDNFQKLEIPGWIEGFVGPNHKNKEHVDAFPHITIPRDQIKMESKFTPKWNNYYGIYFTMTALHGLHVIGGAIVLGYYLFFGRKMYNSNPEWLANRVEVGGLFWHFVDLVWIFLFPIFYLM